MKSVEEIKQMIRVDQQNFGIDVR